MEKNRENESLPDLEVLILICAGYISSGKPFSEQLYMDIKEKLDEYFMEQPGTIH
tara:strand:+ start:8124 stop:8288 length:165 start_codon:yes stop_codon:yes gene_type:complete